MELREVLRRRRMVRDYLPEPVPRDVVRRVVESALRAPSAGFSQGVTLVVLDEPTTVARFWSAATPPGLGEDRWSQGMRRAPVLVVVLCERERYLQRYAEPDKGWARDDSRWSVPWWFVDSGMAAGFALLAAVDEGLGACFFGVPSERVPHVREAFGIPFGQEVVGVMSLGRPSGQRSRTRRERRPSVEVVQWNAWPAGD